MNSQQKDLKDAMPPPEFIDKRENNGIYKLLTGLTVARFMMFQLFSLLQIHIKKLKKLFAINCCAFKEYRLL